jgi:hypothetical protein
MIIGGIVVVLIVVVAVGAFCYRRRKSGKATLPKTYHRVKNEGFSHTADPSSPNTDDDDDELIVSDVQGVIGGQMEMGFMGDEGDLCVLRSLHRNAAPFCNDA